MFGSRVRAARRQEFVATFVLPKGIGHRLQYNVGRAVDIQPAILGFRQWLRLHVAAPGMLAMPSVAVDLLWHEFIVNTKAYGDFCDQAYGRMLHHAPETSLDAEQIRHLGGQGIGRTYAMACQDQGIRLPFMTGLPRLFMVDTALAMPDGMQWILDCEHSDCVAQLPVRCVRHQVRPFIPKDLPLQRDPTTGQWILPKHVEFTLGGGSSPDIAAGAGFSGGLACGGHG